MKKTIWSIIVVLTVFIGYQALLINATEVLKNKKLLDINSTRSELSIKIPDGSHFELLIDAPKAQSFKGHCVVKDSHRVLKEFYFDSETAVQASSWLDKKTSENTYILGWKTNVEPSSLHNVFKENETYSIVLTLDNQLPKGSSLWLAWLD